MHKTFKRYLAIVTVMTLLFASVGAEQAMATHKSEERTPGKMVVDLVLVRPVSLVATVVGTVFFIVSLPVTAIGGNTDEVGQKLVGDPAYFTLGRPLGEF